MADLETKTFDDLVEQQAIAVQGSSKALADYSVGSILRAVAESVAAVVLWLQALILQLLKTTRAATSEDEDLDTWMADYNVERLPAKAASGEVDFGRYTASGEASIPVGSIVQTADGSIQYAVIADENLSGYNASANSYVMADGVSYVRAAVQATTTGAAGNAAGAAISSLGQALSGVDTVSNALAFVNGADAEKDADLRTRFVAYIGSLAKATLAAIQYAVSSLELGLTAVVVEFYDYAENYRPGTFYLVVDDGSGSPTADTVNAAAAAVEEVRACGIQFSAFAVVPITANVALTIEIGAGYVAATVRSAVQTAIRTHVAQLGQEASLLWNQLFSVAYGVAGVAKVTGLTINSGTDDLAASAKQVIQPGTITVT